MRHSIFILANSTLLFSCGNDSKQKEIDLQKKEGLSLDSSAGLNKIDTVKQKPTATQKAAGSLQLTPINTSGDLGQVTFSQNGKTIFYYNSKSKKGKVILNGTEYVLDKYSYKSSTRSYGLSGGQVSIIAPNCKYDGDRKGDCGYGKFSVVTITSGTDILKLNSVEVQDCPDY